MKTLKEKYAELYKLLPAKFDDTLYLDFPMFGKDESELECDDIIIKKSVQCFSGYSQQIIDFLSWFLSRESAGLLGLAIIDNLLNPEIKTMTILLTHECSDIKKIIIDCIRDDPKDPHFGVVVLPVAFHYCSQKIDPYSLKYMPKQKPMIGFEHESGDLDTFADFQNRNVVRGFGRLDEAGYFAETLFHFANHKNTQTELQFETDVGFGNLATGSCHTRLILFEDPLFADTWKEPSSYFFSTDV